MNGDRHDLLTIQLHYMVVFITFGNFWASSTFLADTCSYNFQYTHAIEM